MARCLCVWFDNCVKSGAMFFPHTFHISISPFRIILYCVTTDLWRSFRMHACRIWFVVLRRTGLSSSCILYSYRAKSKPMSCFLQRLSTTSNYVNVSGAWNGRTCQQIERLPHLDIQTLRLQYWRPTVVTYRRQTDRQNAAEC